MSNRSKIAYVDGRRLRRAVLAACDHGQLIKAELNRINVFPVADGDTGTNLALTLDAVASGLAGSREKRVDHVAAAVARSALVGARGNCGMMLSQFLLGFAGELEGRVRASLTDIASALRAGARSLDGAVENPVEGTILTVVRDSAAKAVAEGGGDGGGTGDFAESMVRVLETARESLARTPDLLPVLAEAGVVDAGAMGFVQMLEGVVSLIEEGDREAAVHVEVAEDIVADLSRTDWSPIGGVSHPFTHGTRRYCTEILVEGPDLPAERVVRAALSEGTEELLVIRSEEILKVHLHTDEPQSAIDYCATLGTVTAHKAEDMLAQFEAARRAGQDAVRRPVGILVDSGSDLPEAVVRAHGIHVVPLLLIEDGKTLRDGIDVTAEEFHARLEDGRTLPSTSQPPPGDFIAAFERASGDAEVVIAVLVAAALSGIYRSAENATTMVPDLDIRLVDSEAASLLVGLLALKAAELAEAGLPADDIVAEVRRVRRQSGILFTVRNLDRLIASGRVSQFAGWFGGILDLKPVLGVGPDGKIKAYGKARGSTRARRLLMETVAAEIPDDARKVRFGVVHVAAPEIASQVCEALRERYGDAETLVSPITPTISTHLGPGAWGIAYMVED
ncbi:MAG: DegV family EDD domain-containing protein [Gemmatimonadetes bacterium]|nr:DegV family EDD domain-containing protein [Gemmatimonadota bacterium]